MGKKLKEILPHPSSLSQNYSTDATFFTPPPLIKCLLAGIEFLCKQEFLLNEGLYDSDLIFLEPAAGLMGFPIELIQRAKKALPQSSFDGWLHSLLKDRLFTYEINPKVFQQGLRQLETILRETDSTLEISPQSHFFCMNTLQDGNQSTAEIKIRESIPHHKHDILVVFGNPPYAVSSATASLWIQSLIEDYKVQLNTAHSKRIVGLKGIQDDYVKFIRFAQFKLADQRHRGIVAFVVNNYFLDGVIFRGMRASLKEAFDAIYIIDLHGDPKKRSKQIIDENVFDVQTGICLFIAVKRSSDSPTSCRIYSTEIWGTKAEKFAFLLQPFDQFPFKQVCERPNHEFVPLPDALSELEQQYRQFAYFPDIFVKNIVGAQTLHDTLVTHPDRATLEKILTSFFDGTYARDEFPDQKGQLWYRSDAVVYHDARDWKIAEARSTSLDDVRSKIIQWQWRGFDRWWVIYHPQMVTRGSSSYRIMQYLLPHQTNLAIGVSRVSRKEPGDNSCFMTSIIAESHFIEGGSGIGDYLFPLKINLSGNKDSWDHPKLASDSNISQVWKSMLPFGAEITDDEIFFYCYAILWTPIYRSRYQPFLKQDFPRIPFSFSSITIKKLAEIGKRLVSLHTLDFILDVHTQWECSRISDYLIADYIYDSSNYRIYFNGNKKDNGFWVGNVTPSMWDFEIGGIRQLESWLKNRIYRTRLVKYGFPRACNRQEIDHFLKMCHAIRETLRLLPELNKIYEKELT
jgi:predicted helicase